MNSSVYYNRNLFRICFSVVNLHLGVFTAAATNDCGVESNEIEMYQDLDTQVILFNQIIVSFAVFLQFADNENNLGSSEFL